MRFIAFACIVGLSSCAITRHRRQTEEADPSSRPWWERVQDSQAAPSIDETGGKSLS